MGVRQVQNPPNPYERVSEEVLGPPPRVEVRVYEEEARSVVSKNDSPDVPFDFSVNPYRGCQHACAYCYARPSHEYLGFGAGTDFDSQIVVKVNAPELLATWLRRKGWDRRAIAFSGVTDCYQPLEVHYELTRRCLEVCLAANQPVSLITKSFLVTRDCDLLSELHRRAGVRVYCSIPFAHQRLAAVVEPQAPAPGRRFEAVEKLAAAGIPVGVMVAPLIPGLNDEEIPAILERAAAAGATTAGFTPLRLPRNVAPVFFDRLRQSAPERFARIERRIRAVRNGRINDSRFGARMRGTGQYWRSVEALFRTTATRLGLAPKHVWQPAPADRDMAPHRRPLPLLESWDAMRPPATPRPGKQLQLF